MAKKNRKNNYFNEGTLAGFAGVFLLFVSMFNPMTSATIAIILLLGFSAYKYFSSK